MQAPEVVCPNCRGMGRDIEAVTGADAGPCSLCNTKTRMCDDERGFLRAILSSTQEDLPRLAYADSAILSK